MSAELFLNGRVQLCSGDSLHFLRDQPDNRYDSVVTDPPYALTSITKRFADSPHSETTENSENTYGQTGRGFMGQRWDNGSTAFAVEFWQQVFRTLKPGGHVVAFSGTRTYHRMACAVEDAGFEIRDMMQWLYGSGFPKSHDQGEGRGTALKPANEPICLARKPLSEKTVAANVLRWGTGAINVDGCRISTGDKLGGGDEKAETAGQFTNDGWRRPWMDDPEASEVFAAKVRANVVKSETLGRWPANIIHDGSEEVVGAFPKTTSGTFSGHRNKPKTNGVYGSFKLKDEAGRVGDSGSAARFFYKAKADASDRIGSKHPTVKPVDLMQWLVRLVTPPGGTVLDPFAGTGTTAEACFREGMRCMLVERETEYQTDIRRRMALVMAGPEERDRESIKARNFVVDHGPLFTKTAGACP